MALHAVEDFFYNRPAKIASMTAAALVLCGCSLILSLWLLAPDSALESITALMKANTALALSCASAGIALLTLRQRVPRLSSVGKLLGMLAAAIGLLTLLQYLLGVSLGIDGLLRTDLARAEGLYPGRMSPITAASLFLVGTALALRDFRIKNAFYLSDHILFLMAHAAGVILIGYLYQASRLYQIPDYVRITWLSAVAIFVLSCAALFSRPHHPSVRLFLSSGPEGFLIRRLFPAAVAIPVLLCWSTMHARDLGLLDRPLAYSLLTGALIISFTVLSWLSAKAVEQIETERKRVFRQENETLAAIQSIGQSLVSELDLKKLVQQVTDSATRLTGAQFGAFFYNVSDAQGESYMLYTLSGASPESFRDFPMPRNTAMFKPTFEGKESIRSDDVLKDPRYGHNAPHYGIPKGHPPVRSYLAVPVISRSGDTLGGLFFGHGEAAVFSEQSERMVEGLAAQAAIAMDNAMLYAKAQESVRMRDEFLSIASHELKTPLTNLMLQIQIRKRMLKKDGDDSVAGQKTRMLEVDERQLKRLNRLIDDMLDISRIESGKLAFRKEKIEFSQLARELVGRTEEQLKDAGCAPEFLKCDECWVSADPFRMEQVLDNLLNNALKYGNGKPIQLSLENLGDRMRFSVRDRGIGIRKEDQSRIFSRFERAVPASEISGMGLGLFIAHTIVEAHDGRIGVESEPGNGSTFSVELPTLARR